MKNLKKVIAGLVISLIVIAMGGLLETLNLLGSSNDLLSNKLYSSREPSNEIVIIGIDDKTLQEPEEGGLGRLNKWSRLYHSSTINNLFDSGAKTVMFDILLDQNQNGLTADAIYLNYLENEDDPSSFMLETLNYLAEPHPEDQAVANAFSQQEGLFLIKSATGSPELIDNQLHYEDEYTSIPLIEEVTNSGFAMIYSQRQETASDVVRGIPAILNVDDTEEEHIALKIVRNYLNINESGYYSEDLSSYYLNSKIEIPIEKGSMLINYAAEPYDWNKISYVDAFYDQFPSEMVDGKIVLIGPYTNTLNDYAFTPLSQSTETQGIEIHANAIQTILDQQFLEYQDTKAFLSLVTLIALISVFAFLYLPIWAGLVVLLIEIAAFPFYAQWRFDQGVIINLIWPVFAMVAAYLLVLAYRNVTEFREKRKLRNAFSHYVSPELVNQISNSGAQLELGGERRYMTTLFLDIENFTSLSEKLEAHDVVTIINKYFDAFAKEVMSHGGTVDKFEGDAIMALFGAPLKSDDHALKACQTAMAIRSKVEDLNKETGHKLNVRIGVATGDCIVGNMGSEQRFDYTAMGDTVNTASRLEGGNKFYGTRILVNAGTMEGAHEHIFFRRIDRVRLKGKSDAIDIYEVMGSNEAVSDAGKMLVNEWHTALEYYRNQDWDSVETKLRSILGKLPNDGPTLTYLKRVEKLKADPPEAWDGTWTFTSK